MRELERERVRPVIIWSVLICLMIAMAPWFSGGQEPVSVLISGFALLTASVLLGRENSVRKLKRGPLLYSYIALIGWSAISLLWTVNKYSSVTWIITFVTAGIAFRLAYAVAEESEGRKRLIRLYIISAGVTAAYGIYLYLTSGYDRLTSSFYWPNPAAAYFIPAFIIAFDSWRRDKKWYYYALSIFFGTSFILTGSRAATLVLTLILIVYILSVRLKIRFCTHLLFIGLLAFGLSYGASQLRHLMQPNAVITTLGSRLTPASSGEEQSGSDRIHYFQSAINIWGDHIFLGTGAGTYPDVHPKYQIRVVSASSSAHNVYVQTLSELGIVGFVLLFWLLANMFIGLLRGLWSRPENIAIALGVAALLLHFGLDIDAQYPALVILVAVLSGGIYYQRPAYSNLGWKLPVASMLVLVPIICLYFSDTWAIRARSIQTDDDYSLAADDFSRAHSFIFYNPDVLTGEGINRYTLGQIGNKGQITSALNLARLAERQDPADGQHFQLEGRILAQQGHKDNAIAALQKALKLDPYNHPEYSYDLALIQAQMGKPEEAEATALAMLNQYPSSVVANRSADTSTLSGLVDLQVLVGTIELKAGDIPAARAASKKALALDKKNIRAQAFSSVLNQIGPQ